MNLKNKIILLTGASTGIGKSIAKSMIELGAKVIVFGLHKPEFSSEFYSVDISKESQIVAALAKIKKIDVLINNAGVAKIATIRKLQIQCWMKCLTSTLKDYFG